MNMIIKKVLKKIISPVVLRNIKGFDNAIRSYYVDYLFGKGRVRELREVCIEVTFRCNCRCRMCPLYGIQTGGGKQLTESIKPNDELTIEEFKRLFNDLKSLGTESINLSGGEPFVRKDILEIAKLAKEAGLRVSFTTNGGVITEETARELVKLEVDNITISLDGPKEIHENIRKAKIFDNIMNVVDCIKKEKEKQNKIIPELSFLCTLSRLNQGHLLELLEVANRKRVPLYIDPMIFTTKEDNDNTKKEFEDKFIKKESFIMPEEIEKIDIELLEKEFENLFARAKILNHPVYMSIVGKRSRRKFFGDNSYSLVNKCFAPWNYCRIDPTGNVYPCSLSIQMGNLKNNNIREIVNGEKAVSFRNRLKSKGLFPLCKKCCILYSNNIFWNFLPKL